MIEQPDGRSRDTRQCRHQWRDSARDAFSVTQRQVLGHQFADDQRQVGDRGKHAGVGKPFGDPFGYALIEKYPGKIGAEGRARVGACSKPDGRDADLGGR